MKGKLIYAAGVALIGILAGFEEFYLHALVFIFFCSYFCYTEKFSNKQLVPLLVVFILFSGAAFLENSTRKTALTGEEKDFLLSLPDGVQVDGDKLTAGAVIKPGGERIMLNYKLRSPQEKQHVKESLYPGTWCRVSGTLRKPNQARNPNEFDYQQYLQNQHIFWILNGNVLDLQTCAEKEDGLLTALKKVRHKQVNRLEGLLTKESGAITAALLFGDRRLMNPETIENYEATGTVHLLAISGLHVALLSGMCFYLLIKIGVARQKAEYFLMAALPLYAVLTGLAPPVNRSVIMLLLFLFARRYRLHLSSIDVLSSAFLLLTFFSPSIIYNPGFQLSFLVSLSLILSSGMIARCRPAISKLTVISFISQLSSMPVILTNFYEISVISILANLVFVPLFSFVILPFVLIVYLVQLTIPLAARPFLMLLEAIIDLANQLSSRFSDFPAATIITGKPAPWLLLFYMASILVFFLKWEKGKSKAHILLVLAPFIFQIAFPYVSPYGKVVYIDVGQGDSILIQLPNNQGTYLIDTGGTIGFSKEEWQVKRRTFETGKDILLPYLKSEGIRKIDKLVLTHGDADHIGGAASLLKELEIGEILLPVSAERSSLEKELYTLAKRKKIEFKSIKAGKSWAAGNADFIVVSPVSTQEDKNEGSIVLWAAFGGKTWLFTGDMGEDGEKQLLERIPGIKADVLKLGHHGSKTSSSELFLDRIAPKTAIISAGLENRYNHPHAEVLSRLENRKIRVYRTDQHGAVIFTFKDKSGTFHTWLP
ncbi:DNA internalization-related competence protein ComEC/Rec2 [Mesobacillus foraminis]|uniref:DNA internalization-related competence protein ComEC/Rec2 n=1 Tax=Mesobacillus foraminis TaxID=279826 RepID=UPI001BE58891|nr:DNA internalization-related competence protein ComEC/Rec2 [Mesobacillus foraminis]MBT2754660.1 DNA internalization-related competence protein ComEC/Rec2 [Mesobacillus foraminis]